MDYYKYTKYKNKLNKLNGGEITESKLRKLRTIHKKFENYVDGFCTDNYCNGKLLDLIKISSNYFKDITPTEYEEDLKENIKIVKRNLDSKLFDDILDFTAYSIEKEMNGSDINREDIKRLIRNIQKDGSIKQEGGTLHRVKKHIVQVGIVYLFIMGIINIIALLFKTMMDSCSNYSREEKIRRRAIREMRTSTHQRDNACQGNIEDRNNQRRRELIRDYAIVQEEWCKKQDVWNKSQEYRDSHDDWD